MVGWQTLSSEACAAKNQLIRILKAINAHVSAVQLSVADW